MAGEPRAGFRRNRFRLSAYGARGSEIRRAASILVPVTLTRSMRNQSNLRDVVHLTFMFGEPAVFLASFFNKSQDARPFSNSTSFCKAAVRAELDYLVDVDCTQIEIDTSGDFLVIEGFARSHSDLSRILETAQDIVGGNRIICRVIICAFVAASV